MLSDHLSKKEVRVVSHSGVTDIDSALPVLFEMLREYTGGSPLRLVSAGRRKHVQGSVKDSAHLDDAAFDVHLNPQQFAQLRENLDDFVRDAYLAGLGGFGVYPTSVHIDTQSDKAKNLWYVPGTDHAYQIRHWADRGAEFMLSPSPGATMEDSVAFEVEHDVVQAGVGFPWFLILCGIAAYFIITQK